MKYTFPENLYTDVRIEEEKSASFYVKNDDVEDNSEVEVAGAMIRVFDGKLWYTKKTNDLDSVQQCIDELAALAKPNPNILSHEVVKNFQPNVATVLKFTDKKDLRRLSRADREKIVYDYRLKLWDQTIKEIVFTHVRFWYGHRVKSFYSSKGSEIVQDYQRCALAVSFEMNVNNTRFFGSKSFQEFNLEDIMFKKESILRERDRALEFARNAKDVTPGEYCCVLAPTVTSVFTHESFGHKSEADFMLNDKTLQDEWVLGKKVGNEKVTIIDEGDELYHGYCPYDDEGNKKEKVYLMKDGVLTGRLHDAKSAATLHEKVTGNARAQDISCMPQVRMTNTYMAAGNDKPDDIIKGVKNGIYVYNWNYGTGNSTFTIQPIMCYKITDGKIAEPLRVNVITGSVFQTLFDIDAVGTDLEFFSGTCGKGGQSVQTATGGPTIRVKKLMVN